MLTLSLCTQGTEGGELRVRSGLTCWRDDLFHWEVTWHLQPYSDNWRPRHQVSIVRWGGRVQNRSEVLIGDPGGQGDHKGLTDPGHHQPSLVVARLLANLMIFWLSLLAQKGDVWFPLYINHRNIAQSSHQPDSHVEVGSFTAPLYKVDSKNLIVHCLSYDQIWSLNASSSGHCPL